jgi:hypothetical protein
VRSLIIAFPDLELSRKVRSLFLSRGLPVQGICHTGAQVLQMAGLSEGGGVIICQFRFSDMGAQEVMSLLTDDFDMLVLVTPRQVGAINGPGIFTLTQPFNGQILLESAQQLLETRQSAGNAISTSGKPRTTSSHGRPADQEKPAHGRNTEEQRIIEQAKYLLMNRKHLTEAEAHRYLQKRSMETGVRLVDLARKVIGLQ